MAHSDNTSFDTLCDDLASTDSVITESSPTTTTLSLEDAAAEIVSRTGTDDDAVLKTALMVAALKKRIIAGEAGPDVKWMVWLKANVRISTATVYYLDKIGSSRDPRGELERWRRDARERSKNRIGASGLSENHRLIIRLVKKMSDEEAKKECITLWRRYPGRV